MGHVFNYHWSEEEIMTTIREVIQSEGLRKGIEIAAPLVWDKIKEPLKGWWLRRKQRKMIKKERRRNAKK